MKFPESFGKPSLFWFIISVFSILFLLYDFYNALFYGEITMLRMNESIKLDGSTVSLFFFGLTFLFKLVFFFFCMFYVVVFVGGRRGRAFSADKSKANRSYNKRKPFRQKGR